MYLVRPAFQSPAVSAAFEAFEPALRAQLLDLRALIYDTAAHLDIPALDESLKWGQPSYTTLKSTPIRLGATKAGAGAIFTHCQSRVIPDFRTLFPTAFTYDGNRAVHIDPTAPLPKNALRLLITAALTYRL